MALETASYIANLQPSNPDGGDQRSTTDDHLRLIKAVAVRTFPKLDGAVSLSAAQFMYLGDLSASVQLQLNQLRDGSATANNALVARFANSASLALTANSASYAVLAGYAQSASYANLAGTAVTSGYAQSASYAAIAGTALQANDSTHADSADFATQAGLANTALSASSAATLASYAPSVNATGNTVLLRNSAGDTFARYINQNSGPESQSVGHIASMTNLDGYWRVVPVSTVGAYLETRNITGRTGTNKTISSSAPSGGSNGDIHYQY